MSRREFRVPINLLSLASDPPTAVEGDVYYNTTDDRIRVYKNSTWVNLAYSDDVGITSIDYITFDTTPEASSTATGTMYWDSGDGLPKVILNANVEVGLGQEQVALCKNDTGSSIPKGSVVYISGAAGQRPTLALADADTEPTSSKTFGLTAEAIADGAEGFVVTFGVLRGVNTFGLTEGSALWLSSTAGAYTTTIPAEPSNAVFLGYVVKASTTAGEILVNIQNGYELTELHGVQIEADNLLTDNEVLAYDTTSGLWINQTSAEAGLIDTSSTAQTKTGNFTSSGNLTGSVLVSSQSLTNEGGQIELSYPSSGSTLSGTNVTIDVYQNRLRIFESGGTNRGAYIDLAAATAGVGSNLLGGGGTVSDSFKTISTPSGTSPIADSSADTLTLTTDSYLTITGDATGDSIAFATGATSANTASKIVARDSNGDFSAGDITADQFISTNNGAGTNFKVGDDAWIGDINLANTVSIQGQQNSANGYISFGTNDGTVLGRAGTGALTYGGNTVWHAGNDGTGSGLDADLLDGNHASAFATLSGNNAFIGANTFANTSGQTFIYNASTQDGIIIAGRNGGTTSLRATIQPTTLTASRTITIPDATGTVLITQATKAAGYFDTDTVAPSNTNRLNYDGYLYATRFYGDGSQLTGVVPSQVNTQLNDTNETKYLVFVTQNSVSPIAQTLNTDAGVIYNPSTNNLTISGSFTTGGAVNLNYASPTIASNNASAASIFTSNVTGVTIGSTSILSTIYPSAGTTTSTDSAKAGYLGMPQNLNPTSPYTLTVGDAGEHIYFSTGTNTVTIPANSTTSFPIGTTIVIINGSGAGNATIQITTDTLRQAGTTNTGTRTLAANGMATLVKVASTTWYISGTGLT